MRVLRISHSAVVSAWRERERQLRSRGVDVCLISAQRWNEGGHPVELAAAEDDFVLGARTFGTHPNVFLFDPRPVWRALGQNWDVLDIHEEPCSLATAQVLALAWLRRRTPPFVLYSAQNIDKHYPVPFSWIERLSLRRAAAVSACNADAARIVRKKGLTGIARVIGLGVDTAQFAPAPRERVDGPFRIGYFGRLEEHKGVETVLRALQRQADMTLIAVGDGPDRQRLTELAAELNVADRVQFKGFCDPGDLAAEYNGVDVVVVPSIATPSWEEQFGRVVVEAMASGVPVIAARTGALPEVIADAGLLFAQRDDRELSDLLAKLASDSGLRARLHSAGLQRAARYQWSHIAAEYEQLYADVAKRADAVRSESSQGGGPVEASRGNVHVVVVAYGPHDLLISCLTPLIGKFAITVVDNSSSAETRTFAHEIGAEYVDPGRNLGFGAAVNRALATIAPGDDALLLNPDATISADEVARLQDFLHSDDRRAAVAPEQADPDTGVRARVQWPFPSPALAWRQALGLGRLDAGRQDFAIGAVLLLRGAAIDDVGSFDERFFLYAEETDWQRRATRLGWTVAVTNSLLASHMGAGTGGDPTVRETFFHASHELYIRKHHGSAGWLAYRTAVVAGALPRAALLRGPARTKALVRLKLYLHGPVRSQAKLGDR